MATVLHFHPDAGASPRQKREKNLRVFAGFWLLGLINNAGEHLNAAGFAEVLYQPGASPLNTGPPSAHIAVAAYVIMIAGANEIAASAVGLVYFCAIGPTIIVKLTAPYW